PRRPAPFLQAACRAPPLLALHGSPKEPSPSPPRRGSLPDGWRTPRTGSVPRRPSAPRVPAAGSWPRRPRCCPPPRAVRSFAGRTSAAHPEPAGWLSLPGPGTWSSLSPTLPAQGDTAARLKGIIADTEQTPAPFPYQLFQPVKLVLL